MASKAEITLMVTQHIAKMLLEMSDLGVDEEISDEEEELVLADLEVMAKHILDSLGFDPIGDNDEINIFQADFKVVDPEKYILDFLEK